MNQVAFFEGTGRRKTAIARVRLLQGEGEVVVNGRSLEEHFGNAVDLQDILMPFRVTGTEGKFNAMIKVHGGGHHGQAGAIRHGIARAILQSDPDGARAPLRCIAPAAAGHRLPSAARPTPAPHSTRDGESWALPGPGESAAHAPPHAPGPHSIPA